MHNHDDGYFKGLSVIGDFENALPYPYRQYFDYFSHNNGHNQHDCQCTSLSIEVGAKIVPLRLRPFITRDDLGAEGPANILGSLMRPPEITDEIWEEINEWVGQHHEPFKKKRKMLRFSNS